MSKLKDLVGVEFGDLTVISFYGFLKPENKKDRKPAWNCKCVCGNEVTIRASILNYKKHPTKCPKCSRKNNGLKYCNLVGHKYGKLTVISLGERPKKVKNGNQYWNVICDCGKEKLVSTNNLKQGGTISCGCYSKEIAIKTHTKHGLSDNWSAYHKLRRTDPSQKLKDYVGNEIRSVFNKNNKTKEGSVWEYLPYNSKQLKEHLEKLFEPWMNWDNYGGKSNDARKTWWIDHIVPQSSFVFDTMDSAQFIECWKLENLRPIEKKLNMSKGNKNPYR